MQNTPGISLPVSKGSSMPSTKLKQLQYESDSWKRLLGFMMDETIHLKNRVADILKHDTEKRELETIEEFLNRFAKEDRLIGLLRNDVAELDRLLVREVFEEGALVDMVYQKLTAIRHSVSAAEKDLAQLKLTFNNYLLGPV